MPGFVAPEDVERKSDKQKGSRMPRQTPQYAQRTQVSPTRSRAEIETTLKRYGATAFAFGDSGLVEVVLFELHKRRIRLTVTMPEITSFRYTPTHQLRDAQGQRKAWEQARRQKWRVLALWVKATCEAIAEKALDINDAWMGQTVLPSGVTVREWLEPQLDEIYETGRLPSLLPGLDAPGRAELVSIEEVSH